jgi:maleamate amidohydrolase
MVSTRADAAGPEDAQQLPEKPWTWIPRSDLGEVDLAVIARAGYGRPLALGKRPALVLVDFQHNYLGADRPILEQLDMWPSGGGADAWRALESARRLLLGARGAMIQVVYTRIAYTAADLSSNAFALKRGNDSAFLEGSPGTLIADEIRPQPGDLVLTKGAASAFFDTTLHEHLAGLGVDTVLVAGLSTSGCVRATVVDAAALGYRTAVVVDAVADRVRYSHRAALLDMWMKYAELLTAEEAAAYLNEKRYRDA